jgi:hypothetical protein
MKQAFAAASLLLLFAGCATAPQTQPTHYWESSSASTNKYRVDAQDCQNQAGSPTEQFPAFDASSDTYGAYRACMIERGYVLREY